MVTHLVVWQIKEKPFLFLKIIYYYLFENCIHHHENLVPLITAYWLSLPLILLNILEITISPCKMSAWDHFSAK